MPLLVLHVVRPDRSFIVGVAVLVVHPGPARPGRSYLSRLLAQPVSPDKSCVCPLVVELASLDAHCTPTVAMCLVQPQENAHLLCLCLLYAREGIT